MNIAFVQKNILKNPCTVIVSRLINFEHEQILSDHSEYTEKFPRLLIFGKFSNYPYYSSPRLLIFGKISNSPYLPTPLPPPTRLLAIKEYNCSSPPAFKCQRYREDWPSNQNYSINISMQKLFNQSVQFIKSFVRYT